MDTFIYQPVPQELKALPQWVCWKYGKARANGKRPKLPINPATGRAADVTDPATWGTWLDVSLARKPFDGVGFVFTAEDPYVGIDVDNKDGPVINPGVEWRQLAHDGWLTEEMIQALEHLPSYTERSPSNTGLHIIAKGKIPEGCKNRVGNTEVYQTDRFFTVTGAHVTGTPNHIETIDLNPLYQTLEPSDEIFSPQKTGKNLTPKSEVKKSSEKSPQNLAGKSNKEENPNPASPLSPSGPVTTAEIYDRAANDEKFRALAGGDLSVYQGDASRGDMAFCLKLAFYCQGDVQLMDACFRESKLMREKWDKQHGALTYGQATLQKASQRCERHWQPVGALGGAGGTGQSAEKNSQGRGGEPGSDGAQNQTRNAVNASGNGAMGKLPTQSKLAERILRKIPDLAFNDVREDWMQYREGLWTPITKRAAQRFINGQIAHYAGNIGYSASYLSGVTGFLEMMTAQDQWDRLTGCIPFRNGMLRMRDRQLIPHAPDHRTTWQIPYDYEPTADCGPIKDWLDDAVHGQQDQIELLRAYLAAILTGRADLQRYLELIGPGGTGKGTFIRLCEMLVGDPNTYSTELKHLETNRFETANLYGKRLITITDSQNYAGDVSMLKALTGQDTIRFEEKQKQGGAGFKATGMLIIAANEAIGSKDYTSGLARRRITVQFTHRVASAQRRQLDQEFAPYLPGLVNWLLDLDRDRVAELVRDTEQHVPSLTETRFENLLAVNPLAAWLDDRIVADDDAETPIGIIKRTGNDIEYADEKLYPSYVDYCEAAGIKALAINRFVTLLIELCQFQLNLPVMREKKRTGKFIIGLRTRRDYDDHRPSPIAQAYGLPPPPS